MSLFIITRRIRDFLQGELTELELREGELSLTNYVKNSMKIGGDKLDFIMGADKPWFYYAVASSVASIVLGDDATDEEIETITKITPAMVNLIAGCVDELGLNQEAQYEIVLGKNRR